MTIGTASGPRQARRPAAGVVAPCGCAQFAADGTPGYFTWDIHWAPAGHALAARLVDEGLHRLALVPAPPP